MFKQNWIYFVFVFFIGNLFYQEGLGINALIGSVLLIIVQSVRYPAAFYSPEWWFSGVLLLINAVGILLSQNWFAYFFFPINVILFANAHLPIGNSFIHKIWLGFSRLVAGFYHPFVRISEYLTQSRKENGVEKIIIRFLVYFLPILMVLIFLKLYQNADAHFYEMTRFINLDWISWGFITFYLVLTIALYGLYFLHNSENVVRHYQTRTEYVAEDSGDQIFNFLGIDNERKIALSVLISLNVLLFFFNAIDFQSIATNQPAPSSIGLSLLVHKGVYALITSIVLVILILGYVFRGQLNFLSSPWVKRLAYIWIFQNALLIGSTLVKNYWYISYYGLTAKRIGVMIYLLLALTGLTVFILKIVRSKSTWYAIRTMLGVFITCFTLLSLVDFKRTITRYNMEHISGVRLDLDYLITLGGSSLDELNEYGKRNPEFVTTYPTEYEVIHSKLDDYRTLIQSEEAFTTWRSWNVYDEKLKQ